MKNQSHFQTKPPAGRIWSDKLLLHSVLQGTTQRATTDGAPAGSLEGETPHRGRWVEGGGVNTQSTPIPDTFW